MSAFFYVFFRAPVERMEPTEYISGLRRPQLGDLPHAIRRHRWHAKRFRSAWIHGSMVWLCYLSTCIVDSHGFLQPDPRTKIIKASVLTNDLWRFRCEKAAVCDV